MPITVYPDRIDFTNYSLRLDSDGVRVTPINSATTYATFTSADKQSNFISPLSGTIAGYSSGGSVLPAGASNIIDKFPFATDSNAGDVGDLSTSAPWAAGQSSTESGYITNQNIIDKFPFATNANAVDVANQSVSRNGMSGGQSSPVSGYSAGGYLTPGPNARSNVIDKFSFATDSNATNVGALTNALVRSSGHSSSSHGYVSGGSTGVTPPPNGLLTSVQRFPFATDASADSVGNFVPVASGNGRIDAAGQSSTVSGYISGGGNGLQNSIVKFPFATGTITSATVGNLSTGRYLASGQSSTGFGYTSGGAAPAISPLGSNIIDKFPFSTDAGASDVGDLTAIRVYNTGQQD